LNLVDVSADDLPHFLHLDRLDASDNQLSYDQILTQMGRLPRLVSLSLACNSISSLQVPVGTLRKLQALDLSFNALHGDVLIQLSRIPGLVTLNLSRNCISHIPPEEDLYGLVALEELILDSNDLVQFIQWRALDALPCLRKLSLASNRVKRLKDDAPDTAFGSEKLMYFPRLEELDLSNNEVASMQALPVLQAFRALRTLNLADNPIAKGQEPRMRFGSMEILHDRTKPWYLLGNGCHQALTKKKTQPQLNMHRGMRKVRSSPQIGPTSSGARSRGGPSLVGVHDVEANQLLVNMGSIPRSAAVRGTTQASALTAMQNNSTAGILGDEVSEEELRRIFRDRRENIERKFANAESTTPESFMRPVPFAISSAAGQKLLMRGCATGHEEEGGGSGTRPTSASAFMTSIQEDNADGGRPRRALLSAEGGELAKVDDNSSASPNLVVTLPPLRPGGSARSSAAGIGATTGTADFADLTFPPPSGPPGSAAFSGGKRKPPDVGVREAMRALRAAAKDYGGI
jgi:hypothetical protein